MRHALWVCAALMWPVRLAAQAPAPQALDRDRAGPYAFAGIGGSGVSESCDNCFAQSGSGLGLVAGFGWAVTRRIALEASAEGTRRTFTATREKTVHMLMGVRVGVTPRLSLRAAGGFARIRHEQNVGVARYHYQHDGLGWGVGAEYALPLSGQTVLSPYVALRGIATGDLKRENSPIATGHSFSVLEVGVNFRWHLRDLILPEAKRRGPENP